MERKGTSPTSALTQDDLDEDLDEVEGEEVEVEVEVVVAARVDADLSIKGGRHTIVRKIPGLGHLEKTTQGSVPWEKWWNIGVVLVGAGRTIPPTSTPKLPCSRRSQEI